MARPTNKESLKDAASSGFEKLWQLIDGMTEEKRTGTFSFEDRDRNVRDVLVHLYEWHRLLLNWLRSNQEGNAVHFLPEGYNWKTYPKMNVVFWEKHQTTALEESIGLLKESHADVMKAIEPLSDEELFTKKYFQWTGTTNLGSYMVSATSSHYDWAMKKLKRHVKS